MATNGTSLLLPIIAIGAAGLAAYAVIANKGGGFKMPDLNRKDEGTKTEPERETQGGGSGGGGSSTAEKWPVKVGLRNNQFVRDIQNALLAKGGAAAAEIRNSGGADGNFGTGTERALKAAGYPVAVDRATYERILQESRVQPSAKLSTGASVQEVVQMVQYFRNGRISSGPEALAILAKIKNIDDYKRVSDELKKAPWAGGKSLLAIIFDVKLPYDAYNKKRIEDRFIAIGLKKASNGVWSLSGLGSLETPMLAMTTGETLAYDANGGEFVFQDRQIAGNHLRTKNGWAYFENGGRIYTALSANIIRVPK